MGENKAGATKVQCDQCRTLFVAKVESAPTAEGGERWAFACPYCRSETVVALITPKGVGLRRQLDGVRGKLQRAPTDRNLLARRERLMGLLDGEVSRPAPSTGSGGGSGGGEGTN